MSVADEDTGRQQLGDDLRALIAAAVQADMAVLRCDVHELRAEFEFEHLPRMRRALDVLDAHVREEAERPCGTVHRLEPGRRFPQDEGDHRA